MRKGLKKFIAIAAATVMTAGVLSACGTDFVTPTGIPDGEVVSNGGFVVGKGDYYYFINGVESYTADNTYGTPVKGALMRIKKEDVDKKTNTAEVVIPSLMVAGDYEAGLFIYGDRIYYATPNNVPDPLSGELLTNYLDFKSAKLDGTDIKSYLTLDSNSNDYRYVQVGDTVYLLYVESNDLRSYNTATGKETLLADNTTGVAFNGLDVTDPTVYYTMSVDNGLDTDLTPASISYNQIYRVSADATEAPYEYTWDMDYIKENLDGEMPYTNLGEIVLDGIGSSDTKTQFTHSDSKPAETNLGGYSYELRSYENGGLYFTRTPAQKSSEGSSTSDNNGNLYFLSADKLTTGWDSITGNEGDSLDYLADPSTLSLKATDSALFYRDGDGKHHYLYVDGAVIYRADVGEAGRNAKEQPIAFEVSGATLLSVDTESHAKYDYVYFTRSNGAGRSVERGVINGDIVESPEVYQNITPSGVDKTPYQPVKVLELEHADSWYNFELIGTKLFYADADNEIASTSYNYISVVSLANDAGVLMDNVELKAFTDKYNAIMSTDKKVGLLAKLNDSSNSKLSTALRYYFFTGETAAFYDNIKEAQETYKKSETYLYTQEEQDAFAAFTDVNGVKEYKDDEGNVLFKEGDYQGYTTLSAFITKIGKMTEADEDAQADYWVHALEKYPEPAEEPEEGLSAGAWAGIGIAIAVVVILAVGIPVILIRKKKGTEDAPKPERMSVDTTDDRSVDVYADDTPAAPAGEATEEATEEPAEEPAEEVTEEATEAPAEDAPVEAPAAEPEAPAEAPAEETPAAPETPAETPAEAPAEVPTEPSEKLEE